MQSLEVCLCTSSSFDPEEAANGVSAPAYTMETGEARRLVPFAARFVSSLEVTRPLRVSSTSEGVWLETRGSASASDETADNSTGPKSTSTPSTGTGVSTTYRTTAQFLVGPLVPRPVAVSQVASGRVSRMEDARPGPVEVMDGPAHEPAVEGENEGEFGPYTLRVAPLPGIDYGDFDF